MCSNFRKFLLSIKAYYRYFNEALLEIYIYYLSPWPLYMLLKKWSLANRSVKIIWAPKRGRNPLDQATIQLIIELKNLNPTWGAQKISDELAKIGYKVSKRTVLKYLEFYGVNNSPPSIQYGRFGLNTHFRFYGALAGKGSCGSPGF